MVWTMLGQTPQRARWWADNLGLRVRRDGATGLARFTVGHGSRP
jgi:uncharacterized protein YndB with AHSA1/START domain